MTSRTRKLNLLELAAVTYMMVSGGPYGIEELVGSAGYAVAIALLVIVPCIWSLPVALLVAELSSAIPVDGGFYIWVRRALGPFWGFQEAWLSLGSSVFDMTAYVALFVLCLSRIWPPAAQHQFSIGTAVILVSVAWNLFGAKAVGDGSIVMALILLAPFVPVCLVGFMGHVAVAHAAAAVSPSPGQHALFAGVLVAMWNYMGWDNTSTIADEVERPQRDYPRVMLLAIVIICASYVVPVLAAWRSGIPLATWATGSWISIAGELAGRAVAMGMAAASLVSTFAIFNSLTLSVSRLPMALAADGFAPALLASRFKQNGVPWVSLIACGLLWIAALPLSFDRLVLLDVLLYGASLVLEFVALTVLRLREPRLERPFRMPGGVTGTLIAAMGPIALLICALVQSRTDRLGHVSAFTVALAIVVAGCAVYWAAVYFGRGSGTASLLETASLPLADHSPPE